MPAKRECVHPCCGPVCRKKKEKKPRKRIRRFSKKRAKQERGYSKQRRRVLNVGDECEAKLEGCTWLATDLHHPAGKIGNRLTDVKRCKKVRRNCHDKIERAP